MSALTAERRALSVLIVSGQSAAIDSINILPHFTDPAHVRPCTQLDAARVCGEGPAALDEVLQELGCGTSGATGAPSPVALRLTVRAHLQLQAGLLRVVCVRVHCTRGALFTAGTNNACHSC